MKKNLFLVTRKGIHMLRITSLTVITWLLLVGLVLAGSASTATAAASDGTVKVVQKISATAGGFTVDLDSGPPGNIVLDFSQKGQPSAVNFFGMTGDWSYANDHLVLKNLFGTGDVVINF